MLFHHTATKWLISSSVGLAMATVCYAQRPAQILYFRAPAKAPTEAYLYAGDLMVAKTELPRSNFSQTFEIPDGDLNLRFLPSMLEEGAKVPTKIPGTRIPEGWEKTLLLVFEDSRNKAMPIRVQAINASDNAFGPGSVYVANFSEIGVMGTVGDKKLRLKPKAVEIIKSPISEEGYYPAKLDKVIVGDPKPQRFIRQMWGHDEKVRQVLFILPKPAPLHATYYCAPIRGLEVEKKKKPGAAPVSN